MAFLIAESHITNKRGLVEGGAKWTESWKKRASEKALEGGLEPRR